MVAKGGPEGRCLTPSAACFSALSGSNFRGFGVGTIRHTAVVGLFPRVVMLNMLIGSTPPPEGRRHMAGVVMLNMLMCSTPHGRHGRGRERGRLSTAGRGVGTHPSPLQARVSEGAGHGGVPLASPRLISSRPGMACPREVASRPQSPLAPPRPPHYERQHHFSLRFISIL